MRQVFGPYGGAAESERAMNDHGVPERRLYSEVESGRRLHVLGGGHVYGPARKVADEFHGGLAVDRAADLAGECDVELLEDLDAEATAVRAP